jgi:hypothetical protein
MKRPTVYRCGDCKRELPTIEELFAHACLVGLLAMQCECSPEAGDCDRCVGLAACDPDELAAVALEVA